VTETENRAAALVLHFAAGLPGFPQLRRFELVPFGGDDSPFSLLQSFDEPEIAFVVIPPALFFPEYEPVLDDDTADRLGLNTAEDAQLLVIVTVGARPEDSTVNLLGPIVVNRTTREGVQIVLDPDVYSLRQPLLSPA
jgi:flagellar assembly factor FliW